MSTDPSTEVNASQTSGGTAAQQSAAQTTESQAGAGVGGSNAGAGAEGRLSQIETVADIGQSEHYIDDLAFTSKRVNNNAIDFDQNMKQLALQAQQISLQALQNAVTLANRVQNEAVSNDVRARDNSGSHDKNIDTIAEAFLSAQPVYQDIVEATVLSTLAKVGITPTTKA